MKTSNRKVFTLLEQLNQSFVNQHQEKYQCLSKVEYEKEWISPCQHGEVRDNYIEWQPVKIADELTFENVESALELSIPADFHDYFTSFYSESIPAECSEGYLELLFAWNKDDFARLQQNLIAHVLMKQKLKQNITLFFAVTDEEDIILSVELATGAVWVERVGQEPHKKLADSLSEFLSQLTISL